MQWSLLSFVDPFVTLTKKNEDINKCRTGNAALPKIALTFVVDSCKWTDFYCLLGALQKLLWISPQSTMICWIDIWIVLLNETVWMVRPIDTQNITISLTEFLMFSSLRILCTALPNNIMKLTTFCTLFKYILITLTHIFYFLFGTTTVVDLGLSLSLMDLLIAHSLIINPVFGARSTRDLKPWWACC